MTIFPWRKNRYIDDFANLLADEFYSQIQPDLAEEYFNKKPDVKPKKNAKANKNKTHKIDNAVIEAISQIKQFRESQKLGIYGKARLHMKFMERLTELGYREEVAKKLNEKIMLNAP